MTAVNLIVRYIFQVSLNWSLYAVLFPVQILYMTDRGMSMLDIGLLVAILSLTTFLLEVPTGTLADQIGRKKVYLWSLAVQAMAMVALLGARGFWGIALGYSLLGIARALASGTLDAWFVEHLRQVDSTYPLERAMAWVNASMTLALGGVTLVGGFIPTLVLPTVLSTRLYSIYDANLVVALNMIPAVWGYTVMAIPDATEKCDETTLGTALKRVLAMISDVIYLASRPVLRVLLTTMTFAGFAYFAIENFWQPKLQTLLTDPVQQSWWLGLTGALFFLANALGNLVSPLVSRGSAHSHRIIMCMTFVGVGLIMLVVGWQSRVLVFVLCFCGHTFFWGIGEPVYDRLFHDEVPDALRSSLTSAMSLVMQVGGVLGGVSLGALADWQGVPMAWSVGGVLFMIGASLFLLLNGMKCQAHRPNQTEDEPPPPRSGHFP